ncbi:MAG: bifunctional riboflavin kinase/FAD synthetase [Clostridia bacterium]|nr:bifunctional riboflavin kinase/FAD synthetase [Clostridia bacterium]
MKYQSSLFYHTTGPCVVALGCFDGVHLGHRAVIGRAVSLASEQGVPCLVWTFDEPPRNTFTPHSVPLLTDKSKKRQLIRSLGADILVCGPFSSEIASLSAETFVEEILQKRLQATHVVCGFNYTFGAGGNGNTDMLIRLCQARGIGLTVLPPVTVDGVTVSSSRIREAIAKGNMETASALLGRPYGLRAPVIGGQKLARQLGFPTLNQVFWDGCAIPAYGVYVSRVRIGQRIRYGITNVGNRPTVGGRSLYAETHIFDFEDDLYGQTVTVELLHFLRKEVLFSDVEALSAQVHLDMDAARLYLTERKHWKGNTP